MLQTSSSVFIVYRHKTLTGSPDPMHVTGMDKPCIIGGESSLQVLFTEVKTWKEEAETHQERRIRQVLV